jgi:hypothetical protein
VADGQAAAHAGGLEPQLLHASNDGELTAAFRDMKKRRIDALVVLITAARTSAAAKLTSVARCAPIRMIAANRQHRHLQFALGDELLIVDSVLRDVPRPAARRRGHES